MKTCPYCGKEYPDDVLVCAIDRSPRVRDADEPESIRGGRRLFGAAVRKTLAASVIHVDELIRLRDVTDDIELADGFALRGFEGHGGRRETHAFERIFRPQPGVGQVFERFVVFDKYVHERTS